MELNIATLIFDLLLVAGGAFLIRYGNRLIAARPSVRRRVRENQVWFIVPGGFIPWMLFILFGLSFGQHIAEPNQYFHYLFWPMPLLPSLGALLQIAYDKVRR